VLQFRKLCDLQDQTVINSLGKLLNESHASLRDLYNCSCPELDILVAECQSNSHCFGR
jgi:N-acetylgalactosamine kinase